MSKHLGQKLEKISEIIPLKEAIDKFNRTGTADIAVGKEYGLGIKDEGEYISVKFGPNKLTPTDDLISGKVLYGEKNFSTKELAFIFASQILKKIINLEVKMARHLGEPKRFWLVLDPTKASVLQDIISIEPITAIQIGRIVMGGGNTLGDAIRRWEAEHPEIYPEENKAEAMKDAKRRFAAIKKTKTIMRGWCPTCKKEMDVEMDRGSLFCTECGEQLSID